MDPLNILKIATSIITVILAFIAGFIELRKNPDYWLNRWFALYFTTLSLGFLVYTIYHFITIDPTPIVPLMITAQILYNLGLICFLMTSFVLEYSETIAMSKKYLSIALILFIISIFGYFIWIPELNMANFQKGIVDTETPLPWYLFVNIFRIGVSLYVLYKFGLITKKLEGTEKKRIMWFFIGSTINVVGILLNMLGNILHLILEIIGLATFNVGTFFIVRGFLLQKSKEN
ncbi:MAG: hypothetical protein EU541_01830 [Promethearchaeota archaeon]|nr:MAG: hypothetical protein EU541_01830 [Candidatus Lokiarchaeota archaeon]